MIKKKDITDKDMWFEVCRDPVSEHEAKAEKYKVVHQNQKVPLVPTGALDAGRSYQVMSKQQTQSSRDQTIISSQ